MDSAAAEHLPTLVQYPVKGIPISFSSFHTAFGSGNSAETPLAAGEINPVNPVNPVKKIKIESIPQPIEIRQSSFQGFYLFRCLPHLTEQ
jgi:hypothetical protein